MKVAMWGVGLILLSIFGLMLVNLFGNITVTNQLNYTTMKNAVQAALYDSVDLSRYRTGFCVKAEGRKTFTSDKEYTPIVDVDSKNECPEGYDYVCGEYKIDEKIFKESLVRRFADVINNNKAYQIIVQEVIEYPPKVSVQINSEDEFNLNKTDDIAGYTLDDNTKFTIVNRIDAILEEFYGEE